MKLKLPSLYSQRDSRWSSILLGYNTDPKYTIGAYGCLITSFGMYVDRNPLEVNEALKKNDGFTTGSGTLIWNALKPALGLTQTYRSPFYDDPVTNQGIDKMKELLDGGYPLITHIDFDPRDPDDDMHWLVVYGYDEGDVFYAADPWTGTLITLDVYGGVRRCVYEWRCFDKTLPKDTGVDLQAELDNVRKERDRNWNYFVAVCEALGVGANVDAAVNEAKKLVDNDDALVAKDKQLAEAQAEIATLKADVAKYQEINEKLASEASVLTQKASDLEKKYQQSTRNYEEALEKIHSLESSLASTQTRGWRKIAEGIGELLGWR